MTRSGGRACGGQDPGRRSVPGLALAGREILIQRGPDDRVHVPQPLGWIEQACPDQGVGGLPGCVRAQARHLGGQRDLTIIAQHRDGPGQACGFRAERGEPVHEKRLHRGWSHRLDLGRGGG